LVPPAGLEPATKRL